MMKPLSPEFLNAFLNDHWENHVGVESFFYDKVASHPQFFYTGTVFRAVISTKEAFNLNSNFSLYKSWSKSESGVISFVGNEYKDSAFIEIDDLVYVIEAEIKGIDISKIISHLKELGQFEATPGELFNAEEEIILIDPISCSKVSNYVLEDFMKLLEK